MLSFFHQNRPFALFLLPILVTLYAGLNYYYPIMVQHDVHLGFFGKVTSDSFPASGFIAPILILLNAILLNLGFNRNSFMERNTYLIGLLFVVLSSFYPSFYFLDEFSIVLLFFILILYQISLLNQHRDARRTAFNLALFSGVAVCFVPFFVAIFPFLFWILWVFRPLILREGILLISGFVLPLIYVRVYLLFTREELTLIHSDSPLDLDKQGLLAAGMILCVILLLSLKGLFRKINQGSIRIRKIYSILLMLIGFVALLTAADLYLNGNILSTILAIPLLMFVLPFAFGDQQLRRSAAYFFYLLLLLSFAKFFVPEFF